MFAIGTFLVSFVAIIALFAAKRWELKHERALTPRLRDKADNLAIKAHELVIALEADAQKLPPEVLHGSRVLLHRVALLTASFFRFLSIQAHRLADFVSHKHTFRRNAPRSEFLKKVLEHKNGEGTE